MRTPQLHLHFEPASPRTGLTLVEVLVVIAIVGLLAAIILPAIQSVRSASRRMQCASNQRQLILGISNYHDAFGVFPPLASMGPSDCIPLTPITRLFPYIDLRSVCDQLNTSVRRLPILECPADAEITLMSTPLSYPVNASPGMGSGTLWAGPFDLLQTVSARDITDGLSTTAGIAEDIAVRAGGAEAAAENIPVRYSWAVNVPPVSATTMSDPNSPSSLADRAAQTDLSIEECNQGPRSFLTSPSPTGDQWGPGAFGGGSVTYSHWYPPNSPVCGASMMTMDLIFILHNRRTASGHTGGINIVYMDGHQRFVNNQIDHAAWRAAGTRNGNDTIGE